MSLFHGAYGDVFVFRQGRVFVVLSKKNKSTALQNTNELEGVNNMTIIFQMAEVIFVLLSSN